MQHFLRTKDRKGLTRLGSTDSWYRNLKVREGLGNKLIDNHGSY